VEDDVPLLEQSLQSDSENKMEPNPISAAIVRRRPAQELLGLIESLPEKLQQPDEQGRVPLHFAAKYDAPLEAVESIVAGWEDALIATSTNGYIPLHLAIRHGRWDVVKFLTGLSTRSQNIGTPHGYRPLHLAAKRAPLEVVQVVMAKWPSAVLEENQYGNLPLHSAAQHAKLDAVQCLADEQKQTLRSKNRNGLLPMHMAAHHVANLDVVEFLANKEPKTLLAKTRKGSLPLHFAAVYAPLEVVRLMVEKCPEALWETNKQGKLPVDTARDSPKAWKHETIAWLESAMRNEYPHPSPFLRQALTVNNPPVDYPHPSPFLRQALTVNNPPVDNPPVDNACVICWGRAADVVYVPCGHMCVCGACEPLHAANAPLRNNVRVVRCPYCNGRTKKSVKVIPSGLLA
jgi:ankyrin repeat protein